VKSKTNCERKNHSGKALYNRKEKYKKMKKKKGKEKRKINQGVKRR